MTAVKNAGRLRNGSQQIKTHKFQSLFPLYEKTARPFGGDAADWASAQLVGALSAINLMNRLMCMHSGALQVL